MSDHRIEWILVEDGPKVVMSRMTNLVALSQKVKITLQPTGKDRTINYPNNHTQLTFMCSTWRTSQNLLDWNVPLLSAFPRLIIFLSLCYFLYMYSYSRPLGGYEICLINLVILISLNQTIPESSLATGCLWPKILPTPDGDCIHVPNSVLSLAKDAPPRHQTRPSALTPFPHLIAIVSTCPAVHPKSHTWSFDTFLF